MQNRRFVMVTIVLFAVVALFYSNCSNPKSPPNSNNVTVSSSGGTPVGTTLPPITTTTSPTPGALKGWFDWVSGPYLAGWACIVGRPSGIMITIKTAGGATVLSLPTTVRMFDGAEIDKECGTTGQSHRFIAKLTAAQVSAFNGQSLVAYAVSATTMNLEALPGSGGPNYTVTSQSPIWQGKDMPMSSINPEPVSAANPAMKGYFDGLYNSGGKSGSVAVGWACAVGANSKVRVMIRKKSDLSFVGIGVANRDTQDTAISGICGSDSAHGFIIEIPEPTYSILKASGEELEAAITELLDLAKFYPPSDSPGNGNLSKTPTPNLYKVSNGQGVAAPNWP